MIQGGKEVCELLNIIVGEKIAGNEGSISSGPLLLVLFRTGPIFVGGDLSWLA